MATGTDGTRQAALSLISKKGMKWSRVGKGQQFVVDIKMADKTIHALVKTASYGVAMVRAASIAKDAVIYGFDRDFDHVLFAVGIRDTADIGVYLVPFDVVERAFRSSDRRSWNKNRDAGAMWIIEFKGSGDKPSNGFINKWAEYLVGTTDSGDPQLTSVARETQIDSRPTKIAEVMAWARARVAEIEGLPLEAVKLDLKLGF